MFSWSPKLDELGRAEVVERSSSRLPRGRQASDQSVARGLKSRTEVDEKNGGHLWASPRSQRRRRVYCHIFLVILKIIERERAIAEEMEQWADIEDAEMRRIFFCNSRISLVLGEGIGNKVSPSQRN